MLTKGCKVITDNEKCANIFNIYFKGIGKELKIPINENLLENVISIDESFLAATEKYNRHPRIFKIKEKTKGQTQFYFKHVTS